MTHIETAVGASILSNAILYYFHDCFFNSIQDGHFRGCSRMKGAKRPLLTKICHTYPAMMKLGTTMPYLSKEDPKNI